MYLCFIDESGTPAKPDQANPKTFVMAAIIIPDQTWHTVRRNFEKLEKAETYAGEVKWRCFAPENTDAHNPMRNWDQDRRDRFRTVLFKMITDQKSVTAVACICNCAKAYDLPEITAQDDLYFRTYKPFTERFQYFLQDISRAT